MKYLVPMFFLVLFVSFTSFPQNNETDSSIPALEDFHEIIYPIWHTAYPSKDYAALKSHVPDVNEKAALIYSVKLPGILREKQGNWDKALADFKASVDNYNKEAKGDNNDSLMLAAETLHSKYENLVRSVRPVLKEMDDFHKVLYVIYHTYLPEKNFDKIASLNKELSTKALAITTAILPKRVEAKSKEIKTAAEELVISIAALKDKVKDNAQFTVAIEKMHSNYQKLEALF